MDSGLGVAPLEGDRRKVVEGGVVPLGVVEALDVFEQRTPASSRRRPKASEVYWQP